MDKAQSKLSSERRASLALKGQVLYMKSCGLDGRRTCAEAFVAHQLQLGHDEVVLDLLAFLRNQVVSLKVSDPNRSLHMTEWLAARIEHLLANATASRNH